jgi:tetratricopeptide (TPR) repeat protein
MKVLTQVSPSRRRLLYLEILLLLALICVAAYVRTGSQRAELELQRASLAELQRETALHPDHARAFYYLGQRLEQSGQLPAAYEAFAHAAQLDGDDEQSWLATAALSRRLYGDQGAFDLLTLYLKRHPDSARAHLALAQLYRDNQSQKRAREEALAALKSDPNLAEAWYLAGLAANSLGSSTDAESALRRAVAIAPGEWRYLMVLGDILGHEKRSQEAIDYEQQAIRLAPQEGAPYLLLGKAQLELAVSPADIEAARQSLERCAALQPEIPMTHLLIGRILERQGRWPEARQAVEEAARLAPADPDPVFELARIARHMGDASAAERLARRHSRLRQYVQQKQTLKEKIVADRLHEPQLRLALARLCAANQDPAEAIEQYHRYLEKDPGNESVKREAARLASRVTAGAQAASSSRIASSATLATGAMNGTGSGGEYERPVTTSAAFAVLPTNGTVDVGTVLRQGDRYYAAKRYAEAEAAYIRVLKRDRSSASACQGLGLTLAAEGKSDQALIFLLDAVKRDPTLAPAQSALAQAYLSIDAPAEARRRMIPVVQRLPNNASYWHLLGMACKSAEPYAAQAESALRNAVALEPNSVAYQLDLADFLADIGKREEAETIFQRARALAPADPDTLARYGMFLARQQSAARREEAKRLLQQALDGNGKDAFVLYGLGLLSLDSGQDHEAVSYLQRAIAVATQSDTAELWYPLSRAYRRLGDIKEANRAQAIAQRQQQEYHTLRQLREQSDRNPRNANLRLQLARLYARRNENAQAIELYQDCLQLSPGNRRARTELAALEGRLQVAGKMPLMPAFRALIAAAGQTP